MTNKEIKKLIETLEHTLVSMQNDRNRDAFNLKLNKDRVKMLEAKNDSKIDLLNNRNNQIKDLSHKLEIERGVNKSLESRVDELEESQGNLEFLIDNKNALIQQLRDEIKELKKV